MSYVDAHAHSSLDCTQSKVNANVVSNFAHKGLFAALVVTFAWFGGMKFTTYEAELIQGLMTNSPFVAFLPAVLGVGGSAALIGTVELVIAGLLATRFFAPRLAVVGAAGAVLTFLLTTSFFFTTPGVFLPDYAGPAISGSPGQFLLKDLVLLFAALWALGDAWAASKAGQE